MTRRRLISDWDPEDTVAWQAGNQAIARRNLIWSTIAEHVGFSVWSIWSVLVLFMPESVYGFTAGDKLLLAATATLAGGGLRIPYTLATAAFGGRNWTMFSAFVLLIPTGATIELLAHPGLPLWPYLVCAALCGLGGGNFAASMTNVNAFYPQRLKGWALAVNAAGGNVGVALIQLVGLLVLATAGNRQPYWVCAVYLVLLVVTGIGAALFMDNLDHHQISLTAMHAILPVRDTWIIALLYVCTFGSFIGFSFAFGLVLQATFVAGGQTTAQASLHAAQIAFLGPLLGSLARAVGGRLADRIGGGKVTLAAFGGMFGAAGLLAAISTVGGHYPGSAVAGSVIGFVALFLVSGIGNGSVYKMIPSIFEARSRALEISEPERRNWVREMSGALIGFAGAVGALGGVGINLALRQSYLASGSATSFATAYWIFLVCYAGAAALTWLRYVRRPVRPPVCRYPKPEPPRDWRMHDRRHGCTPRSGTDHAQLPDFTAPRRNIPIRLAAGQILEASAGKADANCGASNWTPAVSAQANPSV